jgi:hypothetical protein
MRPYKPFSSFALPARPAPGELAGRGPLPPLPWFAPVGRERGQLIRQRPKHPRCACEPVLHDQADQKVAAD